MSELEKAVIDDLLRSSYNWFSEECEHPILWYTNKIVSDGALLTSIGSITSDNKCKKQARIFLKKWLDYTEDRGFGWGENISVVYNAVTIQAITIIKKALEDTPEYIQIRERFDKVEEGLLDIFRFHNGYEFVLTIRSYNVQGEVRIPSFIYNIAGVKGYGILDGYYSMDKYDDNSLYNLSIIFLLYEGRLYIDKDDYISKGYSNNQTVPRVKVTQIMDDKYSYSWIGKNGRLGSINQFPVIDGSYQHKTWGLGWQCCPVNIIVYDSQVSFLRFNVDDGDTVRYHPHKDKHATYLGPALFKENYYPDVRTACKQVDNTLITIRSINKLRNKAKLITDSLDVQRFRGDIYEFEINDRQYIILSYKNTNICVTPLIGIAANKYDEELKSYTVNNRKAAAKTDLDTLAELHIEVERKSDDVRLIQTMYKGALKTLFDERISTGWVIHFIDKPMSEQALEDYLSSMEVIDNCHPDYEILRTYHWYVHDVKVRYNNKDLVEFTYDPY